MGYGSGNRSTITFAQQGFVGCFRSIGEVAFELGDEPFDCLENEGFDRVFMHDLATMDATQLELFFDTLATIKIDPTAALVAGAIQLGRLDFITLTWRLRAGELTPASFSAWGRVKKIMLPQHVNNTAQKQQLVIRWVNEDDQGDQVKPIYTPATPAA
jgi:hypothetical protein